MFGYVPQISQLMRRRTIRENLAAIAMIKGGRKHGPVRERVHKVLAMVGLPGVEDRYPVELSQGECPGHHQQPCGAGAGRTDRQSG